MEEMELTEYEQLLNQEYNLITEMNEIKQQRNKLYEEMKKTKDIVKFDAEILVLEMKAEMLLKEMQENNKKMKILQQQTGSENK